MTALNRGKIALPLVGGRHGERVRRALPFADAFPAKKEEECVSLDGSAEGHAIDVIDGVRLGAGVEEILGLQNGVVVKLPGRTVKIVGAGLGDDRNRRAARHALLGVEVVGRDVYRLDSFRRRNISRVMRQPQEHTQCAVDARGVIVAIHAVHIGGQGAPRRRLDRILILSRRGARNQVDKALIVPVLGQRHVDQLLSSRVRYARPLCRFEG